MYRSVMRAFGPSVCLLALILSHACVPQARRTGNQGPDHYPWKLSQGGVQKFLLGLALKTGADGHLYIAQSMAKSAPPAQSGDMVVSVNGRSVGSICDMWDEMNKLASVQPVHVGVERQGRSLDLTVTPTIDTVEMDFDILKNLVMCKGKTVHIAVLAGEIFFDGNALPQEDARRWEARERTLLPASVESDILSMQLENLRIVDRRQTESILKEYVLEQSGLVSEKARKKMGEMLGVTHLIVVDIMRVAYGRSVKDTLTRRLIEVETGQVLATVVLKGTPQ